MVVNLLDGKMLVSPDIALRRVHVFGALPALWLNLQANCRALHARGRERGMSGRLSDEGDGANNGQDDTHYSTAVESLGTPTT